MSKLNAEKKVKIKKLDRKNGEWLTQPEFRKKTKLAPVTIKKYSDEKPPRIESIMVEGKKLYWLPDGPQAYSLDGAKRLRKAGIKNETSKLTEPEESKVTETEQEKINPDHLYQVKTFIRFTGLPKTANARIYEMIQEGVIETHKDGAGRHCIYAETKEKGLRAYREANIKLGEKTVEEAEKAAEAVPSNFERGDFLTPKEWVKEERTGYGYQGFVKHVSGGSFDDCLIEVKDISYGDRKRFLVEWPGLKVANKVTDIFRRMGHSHNMVKVVLNRDINKMLLAEEESVEKIIPPVQEDIQEEEVVPPPAEIVDEKEIEVLKEQNHALNTKVDIVETKVNTLEDKVEKMAIAIKNLMSQGLGF
jgi:hypothetical protein